MTEILIFLFLQERPLEPDHFADIWMEYFSVLRSIKWSLMISVIIVDDIR